MRRPSHHFWIPASLIMESVALFGCGQLHSATPVTPGHAGAWNFDDESAGTLPTGWSIRETNPTEGLASWKVIADQSAPSRPNVLALTETENYNATYNLTISEGTSLENVDLTVKVKAIRGEEDQGGGPIWRCQDENNYYICRFNPLELNYRVYRVASGRRKQLRSVRVDTEIGTWYTLRVTMIGDHITCYLDGKMLLQATDDTFKQGGMVGLWTKADAVTSFDDLTVKPLSAGR